MKKNLFLTAVLFAFLNHAFNAQTIIDFENLTVPAEGYYNGSTDHSGIVNSSETFNYFDNGAEFNISYTLGDGYDYWNGFAYSNQTDVETADWNNYSAYSSPLGGYDGSENYSFAYIFFNSGDSISFSESVNVNKFYVTNSTWAYRYMAGTDGVGSGTYEAGDSLTLVVKGIKETNIYSEDSVIYYLADFTSGNSIIINNWTEVDLNSLGSVVGLKFQLYSSDDWTPSYLCFDNLVYNSPVNITNVLGTKVSLYPNPASDFVNVETVQSSNISICDIAGGIVASKNNCSENERLDISFLKQGLYFITIESGNELLTEKLIVN